MSLVRSSSTIGLLTLVSRILGFVRDVLMARFVGAGFASDAFLVAFRLPNLFRALFAEGAFSAAFVPMFNRKLAQEGREEARGFVEHVLAVLTLILLLFTAVIMVAAWPGNQPQSRERAETHVQGVAAKGWLQDAERDFHK